MQRRDFIKLGLLTGGLTASKLAFAVTGNSSRPGVQTGIAAGDATYDGAVIWSRSDRPALMQVEVSAWRDFRQSRFFRGAAALPEQDYNARTLLEGLEPGREWFYKVRFDSLQTPGIYSEAKSGSFKTAPTKKTDVKFCWSGDTAGQGFGIDPRHDGMLTYKSILAQQPDFFVHCGDLIYADNPILAEKKLDNGETWHNLTIPSVTSVAQTQQAFRERYYYNYLDQHHSALHSRVACYQQWDDHEVRNNWYPGEQLTDDSRYTEKSVSLLAERSRQALLQCNPIRPGSVDQQGLYRKVEYGPLLDIFILDKRTYRGPNSLNRQQQKSPATALLGEVQLAWLKQGLSASRATWKIIASDMPIGLRITNWGTEIAENMANGDGPPLGRELEMAGLLSHIREHDIRNVHFITADVHYCASHYYDPAKAQFKDFLPFWEFVSGPLHAGTFGPNPLDNTFGPQVVFQGIPADLKPGTAPSAGYQFFGQMEIDANSEQLTVSHFNRNGKQLWKTTLEPL